MGTQRETIMGLEGRFLWVPLWEMQFLNILVLAIKKSCKKLWLLIMPGTQILWVTDFFLILEHSITFCSYLLWVQEYERRARIVNQVEKSMDAAGIEPVTSR
jgi:hypothetical protein